MNEEQRRLEIQRQQMERRRQRKRLQRKRRRQRRLMLVGIAGVLLLLLLIVIFKAAAGALFSQEKQPEVGSGTEEQITYEETGVSIVAVGNNRITSTIIDSVTDKRGRVQFDSLYEEIKAFIEPADIAIVQQEATDWQNAEVQRDCAKTLEDVGFDVISYANEHILDYGAEGVYDILEKLKSDSLKDVLFTGIYEEASESTPVQYLERNGLKIGFLSYTDHINDDELPEDNKQLVSEIDEERMKKDLSAVRRSCDAVVVLIHWGDVFQTEPDGAQYDMAQFLAENGADVIIGSHPYVCQGAEWLDTEDGRQVFCVYSLGNFISSESVADSMREGMLQLNIVRKSDGSIVVEDPGIMPMVCDYQEDNKNFCVRMLEDYTRGMAQKHALNAENEETLSPETMREEMEKIYEGFLKDKALPKSYREQMAERKKQEESVKSEQTEKE